MSSSTTLCFALLCCEFKQKFKTFHNSSVIRQLVVSRGLGPSYSGGQIDFFTKEQSVLHQHCRWEEREPWTDQSHLSGFKQRQCGTSAEDQIDYCTYQQVSGDEDSTGARTELPHDQVSLFLVHVTVLEDKMRQSNRRHSDQCEQMKLGH